MKERVKFHLARLSIIVGSSGIFALLAQAVYRLFNVPSDVSMLVKGIRYLCGSLVSLFALGWLLAICFTLLVGFEEFNNTESDIDFDFDEYI